MVSMFNYTYTHNGQLLNEKIEGDIFYLTNNWNIGQYDSISQNNLNVIRLLWAQYKNENICMLRNFKDKSKTINTPLGS